MAYKIFEFSDNCYKLVNSDIESITLCQGIYSDDRAVAENISCVREFKDWVLRRNVIWSSLSNFERGKRHAGQYSVWVHDINGDVLASAKLT